jgi:hypothetical protein
VRNDTGSRRGTCDALRDRSSAHCDAYGEHVASPAPADTANTPVNTDDGGLKVLPGMEKRARQLLMQILVRRTVELYKEKQQQRRASSAAADMVAGPAE